MNRLLANSGNHLQTSCIECQYLHRPNPTEDIYLCLRDLKVISHEIDEYNNCIKFGYIQADWEPIYLNEYKSYI